jgi:hypothetical protein
MIIADFAGAHGVPGWAQGSEGCIPNGGFSGAGFGSLGRGVGLESEEEAYHTLYPLCYYSGILDGGERRTCYHVAAEGRGGTGSGEGT